MVEKKSAKNQALRAKAAEIRREAERRERRRKIVVWGSSALAVIVVLGLAVGAVVYQRSTQSLASVKSYENLARNHVTNHVTYTEVPPVGGNHHPVWLNCGVYTAPVPNENAVHSMEHGAVWVTYSPSLSSSEIAKLRSVVSGPYTILSPYPNLPSPIVASAWGKQLRLSKASDPKLPAFISTYRQGGQTPEVGAACTGGTDGSGIVFTPGTTAENATPDPSATGVPAPMGTGASAPSTGASASPTK